MRVRAPAFVGAAGAPPRHRGGVGRVGPRGLLALLPILRPLPLLSLLALVALGRPARGAAAPDTLPHVLGLPDPRVLVVGHVERPAGGGLALAWSASELRLRFRGTSLAIDVDDRITATTNDGSDLLAVTIDGVRRDVVVPRGRSVVSLAEALSSGAHEASILKRTEPAVGTLVVHGVLVDGAGEVLPPPAPRPRRIEVLGDSLATGFGVLGRGPSCPFTPQTEDVTASFAGLLAHGAAADLVMVAWSGKGLVRNLDGEADGPTVPTLWRTAAPLDASPDVVVVALGANDFYRGVPDRHAFLAATGVLLDDLRAAHPRAWIVLASPMALTPRPDDPSTVIAPAWLRALVEARRDGRLSFVHLPPRDDALGLGCVWHAGPKMHERLARVLAAELARRLGW